MTFKFFATSPKGVERLLFEELRSLGGDEVSETRAGVAFHGNLETAYRACLWSRLANRILFPISNFRASTPEELYDGILAINWLEHMNKESSLAVDFSSTRSAINHTKYGALKVKDAIVDQLRDADGVRPSIELSQPDIRVNVYLHCDMAQVYIDLSGESLHRRGYRKNAAAAPLKENLAAAILTRAGWPGIADNGGAFIDPMCGSGTLVIESALMAADIAPGLLRDYFGFLGWKKHDAKLWQKLINEAGDRRVAGLKSLPPIVGYDIEKQAIRVAISNTEKAGLTDYVRIEKKDASEFRQIEAKSSACGLIVVNPPYGERMGEKNELVQLYTRFGDNLRVHFQGWQAAVLTGDPELGFRIGIRSRKPYTFYNGTIKCDLLKLDIDPDRFFTPKGIQSEAFTPTQGRLQTILRKARQVDKSGLCGALMLANRLQKNIKTIGRWARRNNISCYRIYDADLPEYAFAIDLYQGQKTWAHVQEYQAPSSIDPIKADARLVDALPVICKAAQIPFDRLYLKIRQKQKGKAQYEKQNITQHFHHIEENGCRLLVNFEDFLDTGLFLDHRITRQIIRDSAKGKRFLNLFAYTGTATVYAVSGGAIETTTIDMSNTYNEWAKRNLALNEIEGRQNKIIQADCLAWINKEAAKTHSEKRYDLIFLDPPTFSNSKSMNRTFDVQRDYIDLISQTMRLLEANGLLIFSTNFRKFKMDTEALSGVNLVDITQQTIPQDFKRNQKIHCCWKISES